MADTKISALTELAVPPDPTDEFVLVDKSDTSEAASGTDKRIKAQTFDWWVAKLARGVPPTGVTFQNVDRAIPVWAATGAGYTSGTLKMVGISLPAGFTVTNLYFCSGTTALTTSGTTPHAWGALFDSGLALLRQSTDDTAATWTANTIKTFALSSTFTTTYTGLHYIGLGVNCGSTGTIMTMMTYPHTSNVMQGQAPILCGNSTVGITGTAPSTAGAITAVTSMHWCGVS